MGRTFCLMVLNISGFIHKVTSIVVKKFSMSLQKVAVI